MRNEQSYKDVLKQQGDTNGRIALESRRYDTGQQHTRGSFDGASRRCIFSSSLDGFVDHNGYNYNIRNRDVVRVPLLYIPRVLDVIKTLYYLGFDKTVQLNHLVKKNVLKEWRKWKKSTLPNA